MQKILISSCFLGNKVRYDGQAKSLLHPQLQTWQQQGRLVVICPEVAGDLPVPRPRAEQSGDKVIDEFGNDVTRAFTQGAAKALALCQQQGIRLALLKEYSPSCGANMIYDGTFSGTRIAGMGVTAKLLSEHKIQVFSEQTLEQLINLINLQEKQTS
ncbi:DUF523 domain-containing protein [Thalassotalea mangrovi]|uniref:DUF523 domain-containing protein n=1 Tax=Thalassotalea mangrovi TaxID=2572245 RepID=A0A4U1B4T3_9GAMM|nr:DUF523 domain-containing protein [Thalassotalea mangrovi]TKB45383.1 DUF523 domain-containing protein [Thalassotalea mangrovi]